VLRQQTRLGFLLPTPQNLRRGVAANAQIVAGYIPSGLAGGRTCATDPAKTGIVTRSIDETVAKEADAEGYGRRDQ
jgi:hypothetical protein